MPAELTVSGLGEKGERREDESSDCLTVLQMFGIICVPADGTIINPDWSLDPWVNLSLNLD